MATATFVQEGKSIDYTPAADVAAGQIVRVGRIVGVAPRAILANQLGSLTIEGVFDFPKKQEIIAAGTACYWDDDGNPYGGTAGSGAATATVSDALAGFSTAAAAETASTVRLKLAQAPEDLVS